MKNRTQYQTETTLKVTEKPCGNTQANIPRKWRGNTLVPVIIALAISAIATIAFLNQGANLSADNKIVLANNEIADLLADWNVTKLASGITGDPNYPATNQTYGLPINFTAGSTGTSASQPQLDYTTDSGASCTALLARITTSFDGVRGISCSATNTELLEIVLD